MIRRATINDLPKIAEIHRLNFSSSYSSQLAVYQSFVGGGNLLVCFLKEFLERCPELFYVAENETDIVCYCMGYYMDSDTQMRDFLHKNRYAILWKTFLLLISGNGPTWNKLLSQLHRKTEDNPWVIVNDKYEHVLNNQRGDLLSICMHPDFRGKGYSQELITAFLASMKEHGRKLCLLSVKTDNHRAIRYYERNGFELYRRRGEEGLTYMKLL